MCDQTLLTLLDEVRGKTLRLLEGVSDPAARWSPPGLQNSILWHAGHAYVLAEWLPQPALGNEPKAPNGWFEMFSWDIRPVTIPEDRWPTLAEVVAQLREQHRQLRAQLSELTDEQLSAAACNRADRSVRYMIVHALHDEACHAGEIWLLQKMKSRL